MSAGKEHIAGLELLPCPFCSCTDIGEVVVNATLASRHRRFKVYCKVCQCRTSEHKTKKEARFYWNTRAQSAPDPVRGEAVDVVAWMWRDINGDVQFNYMHPEGQELMTVAQHSRIMAAAKPDAAELWAMAQLLPSEGIEDGIARIDAALAKLAP